MRFFDETDIRKLTIVAHSQGTIIASVVRLGALGGAEPTLTRARLQALESVTFVTMGSPLSHLYQHFSTAILIVGG